MPYFNHEVYEALLKKTRAAEKKDDLEIIRDATEDCLRYVQTVCDGENRLNTEDEPDRNTIEDYDTKRHNAHENAILSVTLLNRFADQYGIALPFTGDIADRHQVADFCLEMTAWLFRERRKVL